MDGKLIAPCGANCARCSGYLAYFNKLAKVRGKIHHCVGCRIRNKQCAFLKGHCGKLRKGKVEFCYQCGAAFPCDHLQKIDKRYRTKYDYSFIDNLEFIKKNGLKKFIAREQKLYACPQCGELICVHNNKCYHCDKVKSWKE